MSEQMPPVFTPVVDPKILVIIVNWNKIDMLDPLLASLPQQQGRYSFDVLVVDNASTDGSQEMVRAKYPQVMMIENPTNIGGTGGFNTGMRWGLESQRDYDFLWLLDNDVILHPHALDGLMDAIETLPHTGLAGSTILIMDDNELVQEAGSDINWHRGTLMSRGIGRFDALEPGGLWEVDYCAACSLLARVKAIREIGIWDPAYFLYWDDIDWGIRFNRAGWRVVSTTASQVEHANFNVRRARQGLSSFYLCVRNPLYCLQRYSIRRWWQPLMLFRLFTGFMRFASNLSSIGYKAKAAACRRGLRDFLDMRYGAPPEDLCKGIKDNAEEWHTELPEKIRNKSFRKILLLSADTPDFTLEIEKKLHEMFPDTKTTILVFSEANSFGNLPNVKHLFLKSFSRRLRVSLSALTYDAVAVAHSESRLIAERLAPRLFVFNHDLTFYTAGRSWLRIIGRICMRPVIWLVALWMTISTIITHRPTDVNYHTFYPFVRPTNTFAAGEVWEKWKPARKHNLLYRLCRLIVGIITLPLVLAWMIIPLFLMPFFNMIERRLGKTQKTEKQPRPVAYVPNVKEQEKKP